jgi:hypothetical protein
MAPEMSNREAIEMMNRCKHEIAGLRAQIAGLAPRAEAYDNLVTVLRLLPRPSQGMGEDLVWVLDKRIQELQPKPAPAVGE